MNLEEQSGVNISAAKDVLERARAGTAEREEINDMIKTLQDLQQHVKDPAIQTTLAGLIEARGE